MAYWDVLCSFRKAKHAERENSDHRRRLGLLWRAAEILIFWRDFYSDGRTLELANG